MDPFIVWVGGQVLVSSLLGQERGLLGCNPCEIGTTLHDHANLYHVFLNLYHVLFAADFKSTNLA